MQWMIRALFAFAVLVSTAHAVPVYVEVTGIVNSVTNPDPGIYQPGPFTNLTVGDTITGSLAYDSAAVYGIAPLGFPAFGYSFSTMFFHTDSGVNFGSTGGVANFSSNGAVQFRIPGDARSNPDSSYSIQMNYDPLAMSGWTAGGAPPIYLDPIYFLSGYISGSYSSMPLPNSYFSASVTSAKVSALPIPGAAWLFASGIAALALLRRRRPGASWWLGTVGHGQLLPSP